MIIADTDEEARRLWANSAAFAGAAWFEPFGFSKGLVDPDTGAPVGDLFEHGLALVGTVTRQLEALLDRLPAQWVFAWTYNALIPHAALMNSIERFYREVLPRVANP